MATSATSDMLRQKESPTKGQRTTVLKDQLRCWRSLYNWVVYLKVLFRENLFRVTKENWDRNTPSNSPKALGTKLKFGKERVHREELSKSVRFMCVVFARQNSRNDHMRRPCTKKDAPAKQRGIRRKEYGQSYVLFSYRSEGNAGACFAKTRGARIRSRFRSINAHDEPRRSKLRWTGYFEKVQNPHGIDSPSRCVHPRGSTSFRSRFKSIRDCVITRGNVISPIAWRAFRRPLMLLWVGQRSKATVGQRWERVLSARRTTSYIKSFQGYPQILAAIRPQHRHQRIHQVHLQVQY